MIALHNLSFHLQGLNLIEYICELIHQRAWEQGKFHPMIFILIDIFVSIFNFKDTMTIEMVADLSTKKVWYISHLFVKVS